MAETGDSYQQALSRLRATKPARPRASPDADLLCVEYFGNPVALATFEILERISCVVLPVNGTPGLPSVLARSPLFALERRRTVH